MKDSLVIALDAEDIVDRLCAFPDDSGDREVPLDSIDRSPSTAAMPDINLGDRKSYPSPTG